MCSHLDEYPRSGQTVVQKNTSIEPSVYQQSLDAGLEPPQLTTGSVRYWSDFNRVFFHPRSIIQQNEYELNSTLQPIEKWSTGEDLFASLDKEHDIVDRDLRPFVEEADHMQGIQIMTTIDDAWGGFASRWRGGRGGGGGGAGGGAGGGRGAGGGARGGGGRGRRGGAGGGGGGRGGRGRK